MPFSDVLPKSETGISSLFKGIWVEVQRYLPQNARNSTWSGIQVPFYFVILTRIRFPKLCVLVKGHCIYEHGASQVAQYEEPPPQVQELQETLVQSWVGKIPWRRKWQPTPVFLPEKSHGQKSLTSYSPRGHKRVWQDLVTEQQRFMNMLFT